MNFEARRQKLFQAMSDRSMLLLYSGTAPHISADAYHDFEADRHFFYLTGLRRENMILVMEKRDGNCTTTLFIEQADPAAERWTGKMVTPEEAKAVSGISSVQYVDRFAAYTNYILANGDIRTCYFNCYRNAANDLPDYNLAKAQEFAANHPAIAIGDLWPMVTALRMQKDEDEVAALSRAVEVTNQSLQNVMRNLKPGMKEYQAQAHFEFMVHYLGAEGTAFPTIAGSGINGCMLHYETNRETCQDGALLLMDLGAKVDGYCADITRTYPVSGKFTQRQRQVYDIVLRANREVLKAAKPGITTRELNEVCKGVLAEGCMELGLIQEAEEIDKYYMHGVSHHLGIDVHDVTLLGSKLAPGAVITDEPGLYIDQWQIGIRIEDDLLITEDGAVCLSEAIIRQPDEIEAFMAGNR